MRCVSTVVGPGWAAVTDDAGHRRLDDANDFVRLELETALATSVVPITASGGGFDQRRAIDSATDKAVGLIVQRIGAQ